MTRNKTIHTVHPPGPAQDGLQFVLRAGGGAGPGGAEEGAAGLRPLEQKCGLLPGIQRTGCAHTGSYRGPRERCTEGTHTERINADL